MLLAAEAPLEVPDATLDVADVPPDRDEASEEADPPAEPGEDRSVY